VVLDHAEIGAECLVAALALVKSETITPPRSLVAGNPAKVVRTLERHQISWRNDGGGEYQRLAREALVDFIETPPLTEVEPDRPRLCSDAIAVRLSGPTAALREQRAHEFKEIKRQY
jgi:phenylacetic acid degradation protein